MAHRLDPLLRPRSIAVIGASEREHSIGRHALENVVAGRFPGNVYPVNPGHSALNGLTCYPDVRDLPEVPDLAVFCIGDRNLEAALDEVVSIGVPAVSIMSSLVLDDDREPLLRSRIARRLEESGTLACGGNGMGFYNMRDCVWAWGFDGRHHDPSGNVSLISHSGSGLCGILDCEERLRFNLAVSTGHELCVTMDEYLDFALDLPDTKVVGLFIETARKPDDFRAALQKANDREIPIVAIKVGRTERAAELTVSHSGSIAGTDSTFDALFDRYGVQRVADMDELATALIMFAAMHPVGPGGVVALHDSGGERQLMIDLADSAGVPLTDLSDATVQALEQVLEPELPAVNPLDGWSRGGPRSDEQMTRCLSLLLQDPGASFGALLHDRAPGGNIYPEYVDYLRRAHADSGKPVALVASRQGTGSDPLAVSATHEGFPVLDGVAGFLTGARALLACRDFRSRPDLEPAVAPAGAVDRWRPRLTGDLDEASALQMLRDFGIAASECRVAGSVADAVAAAREFGYPVAMKTAMPGILHKTEHGGVVVDLADERAVRTAYNDLFIRLGARVLITPMAPAGVEMILGARRDPQFGPVVLAGFGGVLAEVDPDVVFALPPFDAADIRRRLDELRMRELLDGVRGKPACDIAAFSSMAAKFSVMVDALRDEIEEIDVNPVIVSPDGCVAVDALAVVRTSSEEAEQDPQHRAAEL